MISGLIWYYNVYGSSDLLEPVEYGIIFDFEHFALNIKSIDTFAIYNQGRT